MGARFRELRLSAERRRRKAGVGIGVEIVPDTGGHEQLVLGGLSRALAAPCHAVADLDLKI